MLVESLTILAAILAFFLGRDEGRRLECEKQETMQEFAEPQRRTRREEFENVN